MATTCYGCAISVICYSFYPPRSDALFSNYFEEDLLHMKYVNKRRRADIKAVTPFPQESGSVAKTDKATVGDFP